MLMKRIFFFFFCLLFLADHAVVAQELDARVDLNLQALSDADRQAFGNFQHDVQAYLNDNTWTTDFTGERIRCSFKFNIMTNNGGDYTAQLFINSTRPLYKNTERTTMVNLLDGSVEFTYYLGQALQHGNNFRPLESVLDFYVYTIIGLDYDSYKQQAGTPYFQQAQTIATIANSASGTGWQEQVTMIGTYTRVGYINDALDANARVFRDMIFTYHYDGLDLLSTKPDEAREGIAEAIDSLVTLKHESSAADRQCLPAGIFRIEILRSFTDSFARLFPDNVAIYFQKLGFLDPTHEEYYQ